MPDENTFERDVDPARMVMLRPGHDADSALVWAKSYCASYITMRGWINIVTGDPVYYFYFGTQVDATYFRLRWA